MALRFFLPLASVLTFSIASENAFAQFRFDDKPTTQSQNGVDAFGIFNARCAEDALPTNVEADARIEWADRCKLVSKQKWAPVYYNYTDTLTLSRSPRVLHAYPIFTHNVSPFLGWTPDYASCDVPEDVIFFSICEAGCYASDQKITFQKGGQLEQIAIKDAFENYSAQVADKAMGKNTSVHSNLQLMSVQSGSTLQNLAFKPLDIRRFIASAKDELNTILTFKTQRHGEIKITPAHPLVNSEGYFKKAYLFKEGDALVTQDGTLDPITSITEEHVLGKVYNLEPRSNVSTEHIHIAEGFLAGSLAVQNGDIRDLHRVLSRSQKISTLNLD